MRFLNRFKSRASRNRMRPGKYFISHSYKDSKARDCMLTLLPEDVEPFIFPPIKVAPHEFVSNTLMDAILECDGLIYLEGGYSSKSFWVAFERDYGLRARKAVWAFKIDQPALRRHTAPPLELPVFHISARRLDGERIERIWRYMLEERFFESSWPDEISFLNGGPYVSFKEQFDTALESEGIAMVFLSEAALRARYFEGEIEYAREFGNRERILFVLLDDVSLPTGFEDHPSSLRVQLYGDDQLSETNRIDDLIVRLYWLHFRNQFPGMAEE